MVFSTRNTFGHRPRYTGYTGGSSYDPYDRYDFGWGNPGYTGESHTEYLARREAEARRDARRAEERRGDARAEQLQRSHHRQCGSARCSDLITAG